MHGAFEVEVLHLAEEASPHKKRNNRCFSKTLFPRNCIQHCALRSLFFGWHAHSLYTTVCELEQTWYYGGGRSHVPRLPMAYPTRLLCSLSSVRCTALPHVYRYLAAASEVLPLWSSRPRSRHSQPNLSKRSRHCNGSMTGWHLPIGVGVGARWKTPALVKECMKHKGKVLDFDFEAARLAAAR